ncbi:hypothetical protein BVC93_26575 [Mycobacterium sp. MS1601]|nr:hypothetical protein BVC93_26575 [Mycobacterium sp. MS1601]
MWMRRQLLTGMPISTLNGLPATLIIVANLTDLENRIGHGVTAGGTPLPCPTSWLWSPTPGPGWHCSTVKDCHCIWGGRGAPPQCHSD